MAKLRHRIEINNATNGLIVQVGCQTFVCQDQNIDEVFEDLKALVKGGAKAQSKLSRKYGYAEVEPSCDAPDGLRVGDAGLQARRAYSDEPRMQECPDEEVLQRDPNF